jgi:N-acetylglutamate synthase-like GNAT family acetyltransferase
MKCETRIFAKNIQELVLVMFFLLLSVQSSVRTTLAKLSSTGHSTASGYKMAMLNGSSRDNKRQGKGGKGSYGERTDDGSQRSVTSSTLDPLRKPGDRLPKLDFRFAEVEDADDLAALVNAAFASEEAAHGGFRTKQRVDLSELRVELENAQDVKWVVLETPVPEEQVVAAVAISATTARAGSGKRTAFLRCLSVLPAWQGKGAGSILLARAEAIALQGLGCSSARVDVAHSTAESSSSTPSDGKSVAAGAWFASKGFKQVGGGCWIGDAWVTPTPYETWGKDLGSQTNSAKPSKLTAQQSDAAVPHSGLPAALEV